MRLHRERPGDLETVFSSIYEQGSWQISEEGRGASGPGSTLEATVHYRRFLESLIHDEQVRSVVDAGCGDWGFSQSIDWGEATYQGFDIAGPIVDRTRARHGSTNVRFHQRDVTEALPAADLLIVKDVLQHLPNSYIRKFIRNNLRHDRYRVAVVVTDRTHDHRNNRDVRIGRFRGLNLAASPFNLAPTEEPPVVSRTRTEEDRSGIPVSEQIGASRHVDYRRPQRNVWWSLLDRDVCILGDCDPADKPLNLLLACRHRGISTLNW